MKQSETIRKVRVTLAAPVKARLLLRNRER
jgi:hypothetical protein